MCPMAWLLQQCPYSNMQSIQKRKKQYFTSFLFQRLDSTPSVVPLYLSLVSLNIATDSLSLLRYVLTDHNQDIELGSSALFYLQLTVLLGFGLVTGLSLVSDMARLMWVYCLLFVQALTPLYVRTFATCYGGLELCRDSVAMRIMVGLTFGLFVLVLLLLKNRAYYPFQNVRNLFSMRQQNITVYLLVFRVAMGLCMYLPVFSTKHEEIKVIFILAFVLFWKSRQSTYNHRVARKIWDIYYVYLCWGCLALFAGDNLHLVKGIASLDVNEGDLSFQKKVLYFWGFTLPFALLMPILNTSYSPQESWQEIFKTSDHELEKVYGKQNLYIISNHFYQKLDRIRNSEMKFKDPEFKALWTLIKKHNSRCLVPSCPLHELDQLKQEENDDFLQQKKFLKALKSSVDYIRVIMQKIREKHPNQLQVSIEIAYFYLIALKNKQKGMILYNEINSKKSKNKQKQAQVSTDNGQSMSQQVVDKNKEKKTKKSSGRHYMGQPSDPELYAVNYLKFKIDSMFVGEQKQAQSNLDNELSEFRQKIQVSVTMLAEFWSLLADPKCNLKKLYDLTNFLFPLKMSLEEDWEKIKALKNIESYHLYAKYLIRMFNDKEKGLKIFQQAKKIQFQTRNRQQIELDDKGGQILEEAGIIMLEFDGKNSGVMFQVNINAQKIFGYGRSELLNKKVNDIMPHIYATEHDRVLENYQQTNYSTMMNRERVVWGKSKDGYIFAFNILIKPILSFYSQSSNSEVFASIKKQVYMRETVGVIIDRNYNINEYSTSAIRLFPQLITKFESRVKNGKNVNTLKNRIGSNKSVDFVQVKIYEILPEFDLIKQKVQEENEQYELNFCREIKGGKKSTEKFIEQATYSVQINTVTLKTSGLIGYLIKLTKMGQSTYHPKTTANKIGSIAEVRAEKVAEAQKSRSNRVKFYMDEKQQVGEEDKKFIFSFDMLNKRKQFSQKNINKIQISRQAQVKQPQIGKKAQRSEMKYIGGFTKQPGIINKFKTDTQSSFKAQLKVNDMQEDSYRVNYAANIKTKRLYQGLVKQMREEDEELDFKNNQESQQKSEDETLHQYELKPSELSLILSMSSKNKYISFLRCITVLLLLVCSGVCILQFVLVQRQENLAYAKLQGLKMLKQIQSEVLGLSYFVNYLTQYTGEDLMTMARMQDNINQLDQFLDNYSFLKNTELVYRDGSKEQFFLGFALNKLISESNSLTLTQASKLDSMASNTFFVRYNTVNGLSISLSAEQTDLWAALELAISKIWQITAMFLAVVASLVFVAVITKNLLLKKVIRKKTEILEVFFQIPRASCSMIQKQCENFILRLSSENQEQQIEEMNNDQDLEDTSKKAKKAQKKRSIMGEQSTTSLYLFASVAFIICLVLFQSYYFTISSLKSPEFTVIFNSTRQFFGVQKNLFICAVYLNSYSADPSMPLKNSSNPLATIEAAKLEMFSNIQNIRNSYFDVKSIFDSQYDEAVTSILYQQVAGTHFVPEDSEGMNSVISKFMEIINTKHGGTVGAGPSTTPITRDDLLLIKRYRVSIKENWRRFNSLVVDAFRRYLTRNDNISLYALVGCCVLYLAVLMGVWMRYYSTLEDKITATEYILTFIPIDEINKNKKIAKFIKKQVISRK